MKTFILLTAIFLTAFIACEREREGIRYEGGFLIYNAKIGNNIEEAIDSVVRLKASDLNGIDYYIDKDTISVDYDKDDRLFVMLMFMYASTGFYMPTSSYVVDSYGNHYWIKYPKD